MSNEIINGGLDFSVELIIDQLVCDHAAASFVLAFLALENKILGVK